MHVPGRPINRLEDYSTAVFEYISIHIESYAFSGKSVRSPRPQAIDGLFEARHLFRHMIVGCKMTINPNPTFFQTGSAREPYNRGQWGSALRATPNKPPWVMLPMAGPADNLYVHVPTVSSLAGLADRLVT
jgi:hypothetical protein